MTSILYFLLWASLFVIMMRFGCGAHVMGYGRDRGNLRSCGPGMPPGASDSWRALESDTDPVCHMSVLTAKAKTAV